MKVPNSITNVWKQFDDFPMETLTKAWMHSNGRMTQRSLSEMKEHRAQYGIAGNCFDLSLWLLDAFQKEGMTAYPIIDSLEVKRAHVAVIACDADNKRYLCDLGDQWLQPICIDEEVIEPVAHFFPAAKVAIQSNGPVTTMMYYRPNGKQSKQVYNTTPQSMKTFMEMANRSQQTLSASPLVEVRLPYRNERAHWEFDNWRSFLSTSEGLIEDSRLVTIEQWVERIHEKTNYHRSIIEQALTHFTKLKNT